MCNFALFFFSSGANAKYQKVLNPCMRNYRMQITCVIINVIVIKKLNEQFNNFVCLWTF